MLRILNDNSIDKKILIFDMDGTLINTDEANFLAYNEAVKQVKNLNLTSLYQSNERFTREILKQIITDLSESEYEKIIKTKNDVYSKYLQKTKVIIPILDILNEYSGSHHIILATNSHKMKADLLLKYHNLSTKFNYKFYKENYNNQEIGKYKYILDYLNIEPNNVIVFEDNKLEIKQAQLAGVPAENIIDLSIKGE